ncbi:MAG: GAF domain-containing sensor histidine kinase [Candidatus Omnitrophota bacterium]
MSELFQTTDANQLLNLIGFVSLFTAVCLMIILIGKIGQIRQLQKSLDKLKRSFDQLDEQAKLIVKTDLELNKTQEELDKKVAGLYTLQKISRLVSTTLDEDEIFRRIQQPIISELGFEKCFVLMYDKKRQFCSKICSGYSKDELDKILSLLKSESLMDLVRKEGKMLSSLDISEPNRKKIANILHMTYFIISPVITQDGIEGIFFVGNGPGSIPLTEGDQDMISILATQFGQSLENARLFEQVYRSSQELEKKIKQRTKELADALEEVKKISKIKSDFVSAVSHELRTPLTSIKGYASILMTGKMGDIPNAVKERLEKINKHSDSLVELINDLLDISRIESGRVDMKFESENIKDIVDTVADLLGPQIKAKQIKLNLELPEGLANVLIDHSQIERIFINLIGNAIKFTPEKGSITVNAQDITDKVQINVADTGMGISQTDKKKIFDEFYRVDNVLNQSLKGSGLGLSLVKYIVEAHKGKIWVESQLKKGTTFSFTLPKAT